MGDYFSNVQGRPDDMGVRVLRRRIPYNSAGAASAAGVPVGAIEKGGIPLRAYAIVNTAYSAGATLTLGNAANTGSGQAAVPDSFVTNANAAPTATGVKAGTGVNIGMEMPADTVVYAYQGGTAATAGDVTYVLEYVPAYNWSDLNGGQLR